MWHVWCCQDAGVRWQWWCPHVTEGHSVTWAVLSLLVRIRNTGSGDRKLSFSCQQETELSAGQNTNQHRNSSAMDANHHLTHQLQIVHLYRQMIVWLVVVGKTQICIYILNVNYWYKICIKSARSCFMFYTTVCFIVIQIHNPEQEQSKQDFHLTFPLVVKIHILGDQQDEKILCFVHFYGL